MPNTLIALEESVIKDDKEIIKWDGQDKGMAPWNKDQTLATAFVVSCVWCCQEFAKKIGHETYLKYLSTMGYGNAKTGGDITTFWLGAGDLLISVEEQIEFLRKLYNEELPFSERNIHLLKKKCWLKKRLSMLKQVGLMVSIRNTGGMSVMLRRVVRFSCLRIISGYD